MTDQFAGAGKEIAKIPYPGLLVPPPMEPLEDPADLGKGIIVPRDVFEKTLEELDWTHEQIARGEFPDPFGSMGRDYRERLQIFQLAIISEDPWLWCTSFLREPEDITHQDPYQFFDYQVASLRCPTSVVHQDGAEVGKTREIVAWSTWVNFTQPEGSGLVGAPQQTHLDEIIEAKLEQLNTYNPALGKALKRHKKQPHHAFYYANGFKEYFRPAGHDGEAYRGVHVRNYGIVDEAAKKKNKKQWSEFWRALKPGAVARVYSVPDGDRETEYYKLTMRANGSAKEDEAGLESLKGMGDHVKNLTWTLFRWGKHLMPFPYWSPARKRFYIEQYGGEDAPEYRHNVLGEHGDPENTVFPWHLLKHCIKDVPEYRALKVLVDTAHNEVIVEGYKCEYAIGNDGPTPRHVILREESFDKTRIFELDEDGDSEFKRLIRSFFLGVPGVKRGGGDFGFSPDPTELTIWNIIGRRERLVARLQLKQVTYDQQCQALDALDDVYEAHQWGTDFGNAGSAVAHDLQGLPQYQEKSYDDRLKGFMFQSTTENINEDGEEITDAKTGKAAKITLKELSTDLIVKKVQRQELEYPPDQDIITAYTNHTCRQGERQRIYNKQNDHLIDSQRVAKLAGVLGEAVEDLFA